MDQRQGSHDFNYDISAKWLQDWTGSIDKEVISKAFALRVIFEKAELEYKKVHKPPKEQLKNSSDLANCINAYGNHFPSDEYNIPDISIYWDSIHCTKRKCIVPLYVLLCESWTIPRRMRKSNCFCKS